MINAHLQNAIDSLKIQDVYVRDQLAACKGDFNPKYAPDLEKLNIQQMHLIRQSTVVELDESNCVLQVFIRMGVRWVDPAEENAELSIKAIIEAEFIAEYSMSHKLEQQSVDEFSLKNASYHVWPYWRELLSSHCTRMHLPKLMLPTVQFAQNRDMPVVKESTEETSE